MNPNGISKKTANQILNFVENDLKEMKQRVVLKSLVTFIFGSLLSLALCPQFGWTPLATSVNLMHVFMDWGDAGCAAACGGFFYLCTFGVLPFVLNTDERNYLRRHLRLVLFTAVIFSLGGFWMVADDLGTYLWAWVMGSAVIGWTGFQINSDLKNRFVLQN